MPQVRLPTIQLGWYNPILLSLEPTSSSFSYLYNLIRILNVQQIELDLEE